jgi:hypothetical protein
MKKMTGAREPGTAPEARSHDTTSATRATASSSKLTCNAQPDPLAEFERAIIRERTRAGLLAAKARGRVGGRKPSLSNQDRQIAQSLLADPAIPIAEIAERLSVSKQTFYRNFPGGRRSAKADPADPQRHRNPVDRSRNCDGGSKRDSVCIAVLLFEALTWINQVRP